MMTWSQFFLGVSTFAFLRKRRRRHRKRETMKLSPTLLLLLCAALPLAASEPMRPGEPFLEKYCYDCHDEESKKGGLDLTALPFYLDDPKTFTAWVKVHDRVRDGEMPPKKKTQPEDAA